MWNFLVAGGPFMLLLVLISVVSVAFIIERGLALRRGQVLPEPLEKVIEACDSDEDVAQLEHVSQRYPSTLARLLQTAIQHLGWPKPDNADSLQTQGRHEVVKLERGLVVLEIVVGIAPLTGLVGTIHGLITLFGDLGRAGLTDNAVLAKGIAIALNTTLMGLLIAIPSIVAWSYFTKKVESMAVEMETIMDEFLRRQYRRKSQASSGSRDAELVAEQP